MKPVDVDNMETWPKPLLHAAKALVSRLQDDMFDFEADDEFRGRLAEHLVRTYHCTRLLEHEVDAIYDEGLVPLTQELVQRRLDNAFHHGDITEVEREALRTANVFRDREHQSRGGLVHLFLGEGALHRGRGLNSLLGIWGGEGITMSHGAQPHLARLRGLGRPAIVVAEVCLDPWAEVSVHPPLWTAFSRRLKSPTGDYSVTLHCRTTVPKVDAIWTLGSPEYDRFSHLAQR